MENLIEKLKNPFGEFTQKSEEKFQKRCFDIAEELFNNYCIQCNKTEYYFAEIEFYYYEKVKWEEEWNKVTYARNGFAAGDLFYHLSGIDICFDSHYDETSARFGGILIRAIKKEDNTIVAGPYTCKDELLNACKGCSMPRLSKQMKVKQLKPNVLSTIRSLGDKDMKEKKIDGNYELCFYDGNINREEWNPRKSRFNTLQGKIVSVYGSYKTNRFKFEQ